MSINQDKLKEFMKAGWSFHDCGPKTHWEEQVTVNEPLNITWDGNTEGLVSVDQMYKVSDLVLTDEQIKSGIVLSSSSSNKTALSDVWEIEELVTVTEDVVFALDRLAFVRKAGSILWDIEFPECGVYFFADSVHVVSFTTTEPVEQTKTVVHKLPAKFLPDVADLDEAWLAELKKALGIS